MTATPEQIRLVEGLATGATIVPWLSQPERVALDALLREREELQGDAAALKSTLRSDEGQLKQWQKRHLEVQNDLIATANARDGARQQLAEAQRALEAMKLLHVAESREARLEIERLRGVAVELQLLVSNAEAKVEELTRQLDNALDHCVSFENQVAEANALVLSHEGHIGKLAVQLAATQKRAEAAAQGGDGR
jgi:chromosome segregation ATPase